MNLKYIVYITVNLCNGKLYIGVHRTNPDVFDGYIGNGIYNKNFTFNKRLPFHKAVKKYGYENFRRTTIQIFPGTEDGKQQAYALEKILVNPTFLKSKNVYNLALGGGGSIENIAKKIYMFDLKGNYLRSFKTIKDCASFLKGKCDIKTIKAIRNNCLGTSKSCLGYIFSYKKKFPGYNANRKVAQYTLSGKFLRYFDSIHEAEENFCINDISQAIKKKSSAGGYQWRYYTGDTSNISTLNNTYTKNKILPINMYDKSFTFIKAYKSVDACVKDNPQLKVSQINRVLSNIIKSHKGYIFKYQDEDIVWSNSNVLE